MIKLVQFGHSAANFDITPSIISQIPNWEKMNLQYGGYKAFVCDACWPLADPDKDDDFSEVYLDNWSKLVNEHVTGDFDLQTNKLIIVSRFAHLALESRRKFLEKYKDPDVYKFMLDQLSLYCPIALPGQKDKFWRWIVV